MIVETGTREEVRISHKGMVEDMDKLLASEGWLRISEYLRAEAANAFQAMQTATTGDLMMKASQAYVTLCNIKDLPSRERSASAVRLQQMEREDREAAQDEAFLRPRRNKP